MCWCRGSHAQQQRLDRSPPTLLDQLEIGNFRQISSVVREIEVLNDIFYIEVIQQLSRSDTVKTTPSPPPIRRCNICMVTRWFLEVNLRTATLTCATVHIALMLPNHVLQTLQTGREPCLTTCMRHEQNQARPPPILQLIKLMYTPMSDQHADSKEESMLELTENPELNHQENKERSIWDSNIWLLLGLGVGALLGLLTYTQHWL